MSPGVFRRPKSVVGLELAGLVGSAVRTVERRAARQPRSAQRTLRGLGRRLSVLGPLGLKVAGLGLPVSREFRLALERVALDLGLVLGRELLAVPLARDLEGHLAVLERGVLDGQFLVVAAEHV